MSTAQKEAAGERLRRIPRNAQEALQRLLDSEFYGEYTLVLERGRVKFVRITESLRVSED